MNGHVPSRWHRWRVVAMLPLTLLAVGIFIVLIFGDERDYIYHQTWVPPHYLTIAIDLSPVIGTAVLVYWSLCRLTSSRPVALTVTCMVSSSVISMWYFDMISNGFGMDLFGSVLVFHGMVLFALKGRFWQLVIKSCLALLLSWHVLTLLVPFIAIGLFKTGFLLGPARTKDDKVELKRFLHKVRMSFVTAVTCRYMVLGVIVSAFSILFIIYMELLDLPILESMTRRFGMGSESNQVAIEPIEWSSFLRDQLVKIGLISIPFALPGYSSAPTWWQGGDLLGVSELQNLFAGIVVVGVCVVGMFFVRYRLLTIAAVFSGVCWVILWRYDSSIYGHETLYYMGLPMVFFTLIFMLVSRSTSELLIRFASATSVLIFVFSAFKMTSIGNYGRFSAEFYELDRRIDEVVDSSPLVKSDFFDVYLTDDRNLMYVRTPCQNEDILASFFLHVFPAAAEDILADNLDFVFGTSGVVDSQRCAIEVELPDYDIASIRTGQFAYDGSRIWDGIISDPYNVVYPGLNLRVDETVSSREPLVKDHFDIYLADDRTLMYVRAPCRSEDVISPLFLFVFPAVAENLPIDNLGFFFDNRGIMDGQRCAIEVELPDYDIASIRTGQFAYDGSRIWDGIISDPYNVVYPGLNLRVDETVSSREPLVKDHFDIYLADDRTLMYVRAPCRSEDVTNSFFLHIFPVAAEDLPADRTAGDFDNFDFFFDNRGILDGQRCAIEIELPDYDIASLSTGQLAYDGSRLWESIVSDPYNIVHADLNLRVDETVSSREPLVSDHFDIYLADDRTLMYVRAPCRSEDVANPFFLHIFPVAAEDLPADRTATGFDNFDFVFSTRGIVDSQRCAIEVGLPDYDIASIRTGQYRYSDESQIWKSEFDLTDS